MTINIDDILRQINERIDDNMRTPERTPRVELPANLGPIRGVNAALVNIDDRIDFDGDGDWTVEPRNTDDDNDMAEAIFVGGITGTDADRGFVRTIAGQPPEEPHAPPERRYVPPQFGEAVLMTDDNAAMPIHDETVRTFRNNGPRTGRVAGLDPAEFIPTETLREDFLNNPWVRTAPEPGVFHPTAADLQHRTYLNPETYRNIHLGDIRGRGYRAPETLINIPVEEYNELLECKRWKEVANSYGVMSVESLFDVLGSVR